MMYLSEIHGSNDVLALELDDNFLSYLKETIVKIDESKLDFSSIAINFDNSKARLLEKGFYPYEDREVHAINNGEDPLSYYGIHISKYYFPTENYWDELKPDKVHLIIRNYFKDFDFNYVGFIFEIKDKKIEGLGSLVSEWERILS